MKLINELARIDFAIVSTNAAFDSERERERVIIFFSNLQKNRIDNGSLLELDCDRIADSFVDLDRATTARVNSTTQSDNCAILKDKN